MKSINSLILLLFLLILNSCATRTSVDERLKASLEPVKEKFAPDTRVAVFTVVPERQGSILVAKGEVDNPRAKGEALEVLAAESQGAVIDSILVLPDPALGKKTFGIVSVSVGNMRSKPGHPQELVTQVQMGMVVRILKEQRGWWFVQSPDRYLGWMEKGSVKVTDEEGVEGWVDAPKVIVTDYFGIVRDRPHARSMPVTDVVAGVVLRKGPRSGSWQTVYLPNDKKGFIDRSLVEDYDAWKKTRRLTDENVAETAKLFMGIPYLWGGTSVKGFDCSGFTKIVYRLNGLELNRDANQQATMGEQISAGEDFRGLKKGDLLFFGRSVGGDRPERIWHVGIYLGDKEFIHCAGRVRINSFDENAPHFDEERARTFVRARRLIGNSPIPEVG
ncbi:MAG TPA: C40 family peptidase [Bacteroidota bacterium]